MPVPILPILLIGGGLVAAVAMSAKKSSSSPARTQTFTLDDNMPPQLRDNVLAALMDEQSPARLEEFAKAIESGYPIAARQLRAKATTLRGGWPAPEPAPVRPPPAAPIPVPAPVPVPSIPTPLPQGPQSPAPAITEIDADIPEPTRSQVLQMVMGAGQGNDVAALEVFANSLSSHYPKAAYMLRYRAWILRGMRGAPPIPDYPGPLPIEPMPAPPRPAVAPVAPAPEPPAPPRPQVRPSGVDPLPAPAPEPPRPAPVPPLPLPAAPKPWPGPWYRSATNLVEPGKRYRATVGLAELKGLSPDVAAQALGLQDVIVWGPGMSLPPDWPADDELTRRAPMLTIHVEGTWTRGAKQLPDVLLWGREPSAAPAPVPVPPAPTPAPVPPAPPSLPPMPSIPTPSILPSVPTLDANMPPEMAASVVQALTLETDPAKLDGFAYSIAGLYPIAAGLLVAKAKAIRAVQPPAPPSPLPLPTPGPMPPAPAPIAATYPIGDEGTRSGRNAKRPQSQYPFVHIRSSDSLAPITLAETATGDAANFKALNKINPHLAPRGQWTGLRQGDCINVPWSWAKKLQDSGLLLEQDPGAVPQAA